MPIKKFTFLFFTFTLLLMVLGYFRELTFLQINAAISNTTSDIANQPVPSFLKNLSVSELLKLKWIMLVVFTCVFFVVSMAAIHFCQLPVKEALYAYLILFFLLFFFQGLIVWVEPALYLIQRKILGFVHSPAIFVISSGKNVYFKRLLSK